MTKKIPFRISRPEYGVSNLALDNGYMTTRPKMIQDKYGKTTVTEEPLITRKGLIELARQRHLSGDLTEEVKANLRAIFKEGEALPDFLKKGAA